MQKLVEMGIDGTAKQKERAKDAENLQGKIFNTRGSLFSQMSTIPMVLVLVIQRHDGVISGICNLYRIFLRRNIRLVSAYPFHAFVPL